MGSGRRPSATTLSGAATTGERTPHRRRPPPPSAGVGRSLSKLVASLARTGIAVSQTKDAIFLAEGRTWRIIEVNASGLRLTGYERADLIGAPLSTLVGAEGKEAQRTRLASITRHASLISQARYRRKDGGLIDVEVEQRRLEDGRILAVVRSASQPGSWSGEISQRLTRFDLFVATVDQSGKITFANPALSSLTGWSGPELTGRSLYDLIPHSRPAANSQLLSARFQAADLEHPLMADLLTRSGFGRLVSVSAIVTRDEVGAVMGAAILGQDISEERAAFTELERELRERADAAAGIARLQPGETDEVTARSVCRELRGLPGVDFASVIVFSADGEATVMAIDAPDPFPLVAGSVLPEARSAYLRERASMGPWVERWEQRPEDGEFGQAMTVAGLHGVSFAPIRYSENTLGMLVAGSLHDEAADRLLVALPVIAEFGSAAGALLALDMQATRLGHQRRALIREIVRQQAFHTVFQSIVDLRTGDVVGYEALTRFADEEPPAKRFSAAWNAGSGAELELATLRRAIRRAQRLPRGRWLNLNISPQLLLSHPDKLTMVLRETSRSLVLEITEHDLISDYEAVRQALRQLRPIRIAVDDAGAGIANFAHIVELQADFVKVDIGLIRGVDSDHARQAMIVALCHFARATGCRLIAEGVETEAEATSVKALGVDFGQGYWYGRPVSSDEISAEFRRELAPAGG